jgi:serine/threonine protein kinase
LTFYAYSISDDARGCCYLVHEFAEKGSLDGFWKADLGPERLSLFRRRIGIALDVMTAIQFLHIGTAQLTSSLHGNITSASIVLKRDFTAQLVDCGLANFVVDRNESQAKPTVMNGAGGYLSHDNRSGGLQIDRSCDINSFGVVLAELLTGKLQNHEDQCGASFNF